MNIKKFMLSALLSISMIATAAAPVYAQTSSQQAAVEASDAETATSTINFTLEYSTHAYTGEKLTPTVTNVTYSNPTVNNSPLAVDRDYTVTYEENEEVGTAKVTVHGIGNKFSDLAEVKAEKTFTITTANPSISFKQQKAKTYDGTPLSISQDDYKISGLDNMTIAGPSTIEYSVGGKWVADAPTDAGTYTAKVSYAEQKTTDKKNTNIKAFSGTTSITINPKLMSGVSASLTGVPDGGYTYSGNANEPGVAVTDTVNGKPVTLNKQDTSDHKSNYDYTVAYRSNKAIGTGFVDITGHGNYSGTKTLSFTINQADLSKEDISSGLTVEGINSDGYVYTGSEIRPVIKSVKYGTKTLTHNTDYSISYEDNINVGNGYVVITGKGGYTNSAKFRFTINAASLDGVTLSSIANQTYTGDSITPTVTVKKGTKTLVQDTDYTLSTFPVHAENVGDYKLIVTAEGSSFSGTREIPFKIVAKNISDAVFDIGEISGGSFTEKTAFDYTGSNIEPETRVYVNLTRGDAAHPLEKDTDYTVTFSNNVNVGTGTVTVTGNGNYTGKLSKTFTIGQVKSDSINGAKINAISDQTYTGSAIKPGISVTLNGKSLSSSAYDVNYLNNVNAGNATVYITGKGKYGGSAQATFKIKPANISSVSVSGLTAQKYTGFAVQPSLILAYGGRTLREGTDYTLVFTDNAKLGNGKVAISGMGNFTGTVNKTFPITKQGSEGEKEKVEATSFTLNKEYTTTSGGSVTLTPILTPENANKYQIRWSSGNSSFVFTNGAGKSTAITTESAPAVVKAADNGSTLITAELIVNGETAARAQTKVKVVRRFSDVSDGQYYSDAVNALANYSYEKDGNEITTPVINGTSSTTFTPSGAVTRAQFVMMLYNKATADYKAGKTSTDPSKAPASGFADVTSYTEAINWAVANGITFGKSKNQFDPNGTVTRAEAVTFLQRCLKGANGDTNRFTDVKSDAYYAGAVGWAVANGVTSGTSDTTFSPQQKCSRAQAATFIYRALF